MCSQSSKQSSPVPVTSKNVHGHVSSAYPSYKPLQHGGRRTPTFYPVSLPLQLPTHTLCLREFGWPGHPTRSSSPMALPPEEPLLSLAENGARSFLKGLPSQSDISSEVSASFHQNFKENLVFHKQERRASSLKKNLCQVCIPDAPSR